MLTHKRLSKPERRITSLVNCLNATFHPSGLIRPSETLALYIGNKCHSTLTRDEAVALVNAHASLVDKDAYADGHIVYALARDGSAWRVFEAVGKAALTRLQAV